MPNENPFRIALVVVIVLTMVVTVYYRLQAAKSGEKISHKDEGYLFTTILRLAGLVLWINFNDVPNQQKRGIGLYWEEYDKPARNPITGADVAARRRRIKQDFVLPMKGDYGEFVRKLVAAVGERDAA